jgi:uncharacterized membrane protein
MKRNEGTTDRIVRVIAGIVLAALGLVLLKGTLGIVLAVVGAVLIVTGAVGTCPLYLPFGINTNKKS